MGWFYDKCNKKEKKKKEITNSKQHNILEPPSEMLG